MKAHSYLIKAPAHLNSAHALLASNLDERTASISSIKESVSAVEAFLNELGELCYGYESHRHKPNMQSPDNRLINLGRNLRMAESERKNAKHKMQVAYASLTSKKLAKGNTPTYQRFSLVFDVRNEITHPKASILDITSTAVTPPKTEQKLAKRLQAYGFINNGNHQYDWTNIVSNHEFAVWAYQSVMDMMIFIFKYWPYPDAIDAYHQLYGLRQT